MNELQARVKDLEKQRNNLMKTNEDQFDELQKLKNQVSKFDKSMQEFENANQKLDK